ncbi:hypothetical protein AAY473_020050 [Plecturocebus cupreus]
MRLGAPRGTDHVSSIRLGAPRIRDHVSSIRLGAPRVRDHVSSIRLGVLSQVNLPPSHKDQRYLPEPEPGTG